MEEKKQGRIGRLFALRAQMPTRHPRAGRVLLALYPLFIVLVCELNQSQKFGDMFGFWFTRPTVLLFDVLLVGLIYAAFLLLFRRGHLAVLLTALPLYIFSCVEFFKCRTSGSHFVLGDLVMTTNASDIARFADIQITPVLALCFFLVLGYWAAVFWLGPTLPLAGRRRFATMGTVAAVLVCFFAVPTVSAGAMDLFDIRAESAYNTFEQSDKFTSNQMIANLVETALSQNESLAKRESDYRAYLNTAAAKSGRETAAAADYKKPNVVIVLSESYADFRALKELGVRDEIYQNADRVAAEGTSGTAAVPTFGGYTVRSEFELLFGLPVRSLYNAEIPHKLLKERAQAAFPRYYQSLGYETTYLHPFSGTFYGRDKTYNNYGFDRMLFQGDLSVPQKNYKTYTDDGCVFDQIEQLIDESDQPQMVFAMTMQNHQPYLDENSSLTEIDYYLDKIHHTDEALGRFITDLRASDEPTIVLFMGDHFPSFTASGDVYSQLGIGSDNCDVLYQQRYLVWSNYGADLSAFPTGEKVSSFYLPYLLLKTTGAPLTADQNAALDEMERQPLYDYQFSQGDDLFWDMLTYDVVLGDQAIRTLPQGSAQ